MENLLSNCHTHTFKCQHTLGTNEDYVLAAIAAGMQCLGFADHVPIINVDHSSPRMDISEMKNYFDSILELKEKYKDKIDIRLGFEAEYIKE